MCFSLKYTFFKQTTNKVHQFLVQIVILK